MSIVSGDREHPLRNTASQSSYNVQDKFFMVKDVGTVVGAPTTTPKTENVTTDDASLFNATSATYDGTKNGFYVSLVGGGTSDTRARRA